MKKFTTRTITIIAFSVALNYIGGAIALFLRLPIYLDSIGTIFSATLLGPGFGALTGTISALLSGITADLFLCIMRLFKSLLVCVLVFS